MALFTPRIFNEILPEMIGRLTSSTPLTDVNLGSVWTTMLEAAAQEDDEQYFQMLEIIRGYSLDNLTGTDLDDKALEFGITRRTARYASTPVTIGDTAVTKIETGVYSGLPGAPAGQQSINGDSATGFPVTGTIIIGRGTPRVEPVVYSSITVNATYVTFNLSSGLIYDHGTDETIILAQGGNRTVSSGAIVIVPASDLNPKIQFTLDSSATILDGEREVVGTIATASAAGSKANVPIGAISKFDSTPFSTAYITNPARITNGLDDENDQELRDRIKKTIQSLSRGTGTSIINSAIEVVSTSDNKRVVSASLVEPTIPADVVKLYIDDGTGIVFEFNHIGIEVVVPSATGGEKFLYVNNVPMVKAFAETQNSEPFNLVGNETLFVDANGVVETITFASTDFASPGAATAQEVMRKINSAATFFESRKSSAGTKVKIFARSNWDEQITVTGGTANASNKLSFPTDTKYTSKLYRVRDNTVELLSKDGATANIEAGLPAGYNMSVKKNFVVVTDGKNSNPQIAWLNPADFVSPASVSSAEIVAVLNGQLSGLMASRSSNNIKFQLISNLKRSASSKIRVIENFTKVLNEESAVLIDRTTEAAAGTNFNPFAAVSDYLYVGISDVKFFTLWVNVTNVPSASIVPLFEAYDADTASWVNTGAYDATNGFQVTGHITFGRPPGWAPVVVSGSTLYWFRIQRTAGALVTPPIINYAKVASSNLVFGFSQSEISGSDKDYTLNRFIGQIELESPLNPFDKISIGSDETRAFLVMGAVAPANLSGGETLNLLVDGIAQTVNFLITDFVIPGAATAGEIATRITLDIAGVSTTTVASGSKTKVMSNSWNGGSLQVTGGTANVFLQFPTDLVTAFVSHFPAVVSAVGPSFSLLTGKNLIVVIDDNFSNNFTIPAFRASIAGVGSTASALIDTTLNATFPLAADLSGFKIIMKTGAQAGSARTISSYVPGTGTLNLSVALGGAPAPGDTFDIIPQNVAQFVKFWNNKLITLISTVASITSANGGQRIQIASLTSSEDASVYVTGGDANIVLGFPTAVVRGIDGYRYFTGLPQEVQWTIDGKDADVENYPGIRAAGVQLEVLEPVTVPQRVEVIIVTREGVTLTAITNDIKSAISAYINNLKVGADVFVSDILVAVKAVSGVSDCHVAYPPDNVAIADSELPRIADSDILVG